MCLLLMGVERLFAGLLLLLQCLAIVSGDCAKYGCTLSASFTCPTDFYSGSFWPELAQSYQDDNWKPTGAGCVTNQGNVDCPLEDKKRGRNILMSWDVDNQFASWNITMQALVTLPLISYYGETYVADGFKLCAFQSNHKPFGPCAVMDPVTGPLFDMTVVSQQFLYLLYKCGFMVAYFISDGTAYASIWLNTTVDGVNGTFIPLSPPAVSGERVYFIAGFKPLHSAPSPPNSLHLRMYAIDVRSIMVERIKVAWYHDMVLSDAELPYLQSLQAECIGTSYPWETPSGNVLVEDGIVVATVNYGSQIPPSCHQGACQESAPASMHSVIMSLTDKGDSFQLNFEGKNTPPFQAVVYASPNFTRSKCSPTAPPPAPSVWVSYSVNGNSQIRNIDIKTGDVISTISIAALQDITLTSKMAIFYNDQVMECGSSRSEEMLIPLVFGYATKGGDYYIAAVDISPNPAELRWTVKTFDNSPPVGQITTVGKGRDTWMIVTTTQGCFFYLLYSDRASHHASL